MKQILIIGATGNIGKAVIQQLVKSKERIIIKAGVRKLKDVEVLLPFSEDITPVLFDFEKTETFHPALENCTCLFLLRPPQLSDVNKYFEPIVKAAKYQGIQHIIFLSVQGVEESSIIPHHKIEKLIVESGISYTFLRPAYFMQNFTTSLRKDIIEKQIIFLPAGKARFTVIDVNDVAKAAVPVILQPEQHANKAYELTNEEHLNFDEMASIISKERGRKIRFISPTLLQFFLQKKKEGVPAGFILVMIMLHYLPRFQDTPKTTSRVQELSGQQPKSFAEFVAENKEELGG